MHLRVHVLIQLLRFYLFVNVGATPSKRSLLQRYLEDLAGDIFCRWSVY